MGHGLQGVLSDDEHPGEDLFAFSLSDKQDIHLSRNWVASNFELDPGATFAFQVDQLDEGGAGAPGGVQSDTTRHAIAINHRCAAASPTLLGDHEGRLLSRCMQSGATLPSPSRSADENQVFPIGRHAGADNSPGGPGRNLQMCGRVLDILHNLRGAFRIGTFWH